MSKKLQLADNVEYASMHIKEIIIIKERAQKMTLWQQIQPYLDDTGLLVAPDGGNDNRQLYTAYLIREMQNLGEDISSISITLMTYSLRNSVCSGLYRRSPGSDNSMDNLIGICYTSQALAHCIDDRWKSHFACFDCDRPEWRGFGRYWFGRFLGVRAYIEACMGWTPGFFISCVWGAVTLWSTYRSTGASNPLLLSLQCDKMKARGRMLWVVKRFEKKYNVRELYAEYFGASHPLTLSRK